MGPAFHPSGWPRVVHPQSTGRSCLFRIPASATPARSRCAAKTNRPCIHRCALTFRRYQARALSISPVSIEAEGRVRTGSNGSTRFTSHQPTCHPAGVPAQHFGFPQFGIRRPTATRTFRKLDDTSAQYVYKSTCLACKSTCSTPFSGTEPIAKGPAPPGEDLPCPP